MNVLSNPIGEMRQERAWRLTLDGEDSRIVSDHEDTLEHVIAPGIERLLREHFQRGVMPAMAMENAIAVIEDEIALVPRALHGIALFSNTPSVGEIARAAGLGVGDTSLTRDAVEHVFSRQSSVAMGRPASSEGLPETPTFVPALLLVRELMHHLDIASIHLDGPGLAATTVVTAVPPSEGATQ